jgi:hypothetical protein
LGVAIVNPDMVGLPHTNLKGTEVAPQI